MIRFYDEYSSPRTLLVCSYNGIITQSSGARRRKKTVHPRYKTRGPSSRTIDLIICGIDKYCFPSVGAEAHLVMITSAGLDIVHAKKAAETEAAICTFGLSPFSNKFCDNAYVLKPS